MADSRVTIDVGMNTSQPTKAVKSLKSQAASLAAVYRKQGMSMSDAMKKAWSEIERESAEGSRNVSKSASNIKNAFTSLGSTVSRLGGMLASVLAPIALVSFAKECIELGSSLEEVQNVVDVSFGAMSQRMEEFASTAITQFGMSELAAKKTGSTYMAMAKGLGVAESAAADMSLALTGLSGDVASFYNVDQEVAAKKLQGVFTGETEALKELGVVMTQTNLKQFALTHGMNANIEAMSQAELVALRYAFVTDALSLASGDFVRTQDSWANQTRILSMQWQQFMGIIGQTLTTVLVPVIKVLNTIVSALINVAKAVQSVIVGLFGGSTGAVAEQNAAVAESALAGAAAEDKLADATKAAGKEAKKALAGFDELNVLQSKTGGGSGSGSDTSASAGGISTGALTADVGVADTISPKLQAITEKIKSFIEPLENIDLSPAIASFRNLGQSILGLGAIVTDNLEWVWFNILVPLSEWVIEEAAPAVINTLAEAFRFLGTVLDPVYKGLQKLFGHLKPVFSFIGDYVLLVLQKWRELFQKLASVFEEKGPKLEGIISNIGEILGVIWSTVIQPILLKLQSLWSVTFDLLGDILGLAIGWCIDWLYGLTEFIAGVFTGDWDRAWAGLLSISEGFSELWEGIKEIFSPVVEWFDTNIIQPIADFFSGLWEDISTWASDAWESISGWASDAWESIKEFFSPAIEWFDELLSSVSQTFDDIFYNIGVIVSGCWEIIKAVWSIVSDWFDENIIRPVAGFFEELWEDVSGWASQAWDDICAVFSTIASWVDENVIQPVSGFFEDMWDDISQWAEDLWEDITEIFGRVVGFFKDILNGIIEALNSALSWIFSGINKILSSLKNMEIAGIQPFSGIRTITVPQIPYLAKGAVLPANKPFLAMVGDQKHGTNVEAPLTTIQEALALVMEDYAAANLAGHEAVVAVLREILEAVLGIELTDAMVGQAVQRYNARMAIVRGG